MPESPDWGRVILAACLVAAALTLAIVLRMVIGRLLRRAGDTRAAWDDLAARVFYDVAVPVALLGGVWAAANVVELTPRSLRITETVLTGLTILVITLACARLMSGVVAQVATARQGVAANVTIFANITRVLVLGIGLLIMLQSVGVKITPLLGALGVGGLAVALALQDTLANLFAGVHVLASKTIEPGDYIKLATGQEGYVVDINWRNTSIRTLSDNVEVIPNQRFSDTILTNYHRPAQDMSLIVGASVSYGSDLEHVERVVAEVGDEVSKEIGGAVEEHETLVRFHTFADSAVEFNVILRITEFGEQFRIKHEFLKRLHRRFQNEGIEIPYPHLQLLAPRGANGHSPGLVDLDG
jgi:small-conductance mechanosensitive channel